MYIGYQQVTVSNSVLTVANLTVPAQTTYVELQCDDDAKNVRYTMDNSTAPTVSSGMVLVAGENPKQFDVTDLNRIKMIRDGASDATLNIHYVGSALDPSA